ncbi:uncharacterized protein LOC135227000 [Macrobrachium nipponense]|uniref:uncharacterized protein LOC135227000 n=1 Tax=Macrobrachium nipponense TaxID=159736 RepID=UPI0030C80177
MNNDGQMLSYSRRGHSENTESLLSSPVRPTEICLCCKEAFDMARRPVVLGCCHRVCERCVKGAMTESRCKMCPECGQTFESFTPNIRRKLERPMLPHPRPGKTAIIRAQEREGPPRVSHSKLEGRPSLCSQRYDLHKDKRSSKLDVFLSNHLSACDESMENCQNNLSLIATSIQDNEVAKKYLLQCNKKLEAVEKYSTKLQEANTKRIKNLDKENAKLKAYRCHIEADSKKIRAFHGKLGLVNTFQNAAQLTDQDPHVEVSNRLQDIQSCLKTGDLKRNRYQQICEGQEVILEVIEECLKQREEESGEEDFNSCDVEEYEEPCKITTMLASLSIQPEELTVTDLRRMDQNTKCLIVKGSVFASQNFKCRKRFARLYISENDELLMGHLQDLDLPPCAHIVEYSAVMGLQESYSQQSFLDLSNARTDLGRLYIKIFPQSMRGRQFHVLCTGEMGPSYANTRILEVCNKGHEKLESLRCGDYEYDNGTGGKVLVPFITEAVPFMPNDATHKQTSALSGSLTGIGRCEGKAGQFKIYMRHDNNRTVNTAFARVQSGMNILHKAIVRHPNIAEVFIKECGVVLWNVGNTF